MAAMKNQAIRYLALDVHQATTVATVRNESGAISMRATVATEAKAIVGLVKAIGVRVHVVFEEGTQAQWLHDLLIPRASHVGQTLTLHPHVHCVVPGGGFSVHGRQWRSTAKSSFFLPVRVLSRRFRTLLTRSLRQAWRAR
jgi:hypothetical protein